MVNDEMGKKTISLVVPCYNEQEALPFFYEAVKKVFEIGDGRYLIVEA